MVEVAFERRSKTHPSAVLSLRYDDYDGLQARGIDLSSLGYAYRDEGEPQAFRTIRAGLRRRRAGTDPNADRVPPFPSEQQHRDAFPLK